MSNAILEAAQKPQSVTFNSTTPSLMESISRKGFYMHCKKIGDLAFVWQ